MMTTRNTFAVLIACCLALMFAECARAAPAMAQSCGGHGGTALRVGVQGPVTLTDDQTTDPPIYIGPDGYWTRCPTPSTKPPPKPQSCPGDGRAATWTVGERTCTTARPRSSELANARRQSLQSGQYQTLRQWIGPMRGTIIERCTDGVRSTVSATCRPATECDTGWAHSANGTTYRIDARPQSARIPIGAYSQAAGSDGSTLRVQCLAGEIVAAPQCVAGQRVTQVFSGGPIDPATGKHIGDVRIYEYAGPPIDPGKLVTLSQVEGRRKPDGSPRTLVARCAASGRLQ